MLVISSTTLIVVHLQILIILALSKAIYKKEGLERDLALAMFLFFMFGFIARIAYFYNDIIFPEERIYHEIGLFFTIAAFVPLFAVAEKYLIRKTKKVLTLMCIVIAPLVFWNGLFGFAYAPFVLITLALFIHFYRKTEGNVKRMSFVVIVGFILYGFGYSIGAEALKYAVSIILNSNYISLALIIMAIGNALIAYGLYGIRSLAELYWRSKLISYYIIHRKSTMKFIEISFMELEADKELFASVIKGFKDVLDNVEQSIKETSTNIGIHIVNYVLKYLYDELSQRYPEQTVMRVMRYIIRGMKKAITTAQKAEKIVTDANISSIGELLSVIGIEIATALKSEIKTKEEFLVYKKPNLVVIVYLTRNASHVIVAKEDLSCIRARLKKIANLFEKKYRKTLSEFWRTGKIEREEEIREFITKNMLK